MSKRDELLNPDYWKARAKEVRTTADQLEDGVAKAMALKIADMYEEMASRAAEQERAMKKPGQD